MFNDLLRVYLVFNLLIQTYCLITYPTVFGAVLIVVAVYCCDLAFNKSRT